MLNGKMSTLSMIIQMLSREPVVLSFYPFPWVRFSIENALLCNTHDVPRDSNKLKTRLKVLTSPCVG